MSNLKTEKARKLIIKKGDKEVSFANSYAANHFLGIDIGFEFEMICESTGSKLFAMQGPSHWDDGMEMTPSEWAKVATVLVLGYSYGDVQIVSDSL